MNFIKGPDSRPAASSWAGAHPQRLRHRPRQADRSGQGGNRGGFEGPQLDRRHRDPLYGQQDPDYRGDRRTVKDKADRRHLLYPGRVRPGRDADCLRSQAGRFPPDRVKPALPLFALTGHLRGHHAGAGGRAAEGSSPSRRCSRSNIDFQGEVITRRTEYDLKRAADRAHILEGSNGRLISSTRSSPPSAPARAGPLRRKPPSWKSSGLTTPRRAPLSLTGWAAGRAGNPQNRGGTGRAGGENPRIPGLTQRLSKIMEVFKKELGRDPRQIRRPPPHRDPGGRRGRRYRGFNPRGGLRRDADPLRVCQTAGFLRL